MLLFFVPGRPAAQGSKRHVGGGRFIEASKYLPAWRKAITQTAQTIAIASDWEQADGPIQLHLDFYLARPQSVSRTARPFPVKPPDLDKLVRAVCDGLTDAGIWEDDSQVIRLIARKDYADTMEPGVHIQVTRLSNEPEEISTDRLV
jgi:crossover junction endodeoxyribonuclease RusA